MRVLITGGSGLIGKKMTDMLLDSGHEVAWLSRNKKEVKHVCIFAWNIDRNYMDAAALQWADAIVHLAGESIADERWTTRRRHNIVKSRVRGTAVLKKYLEAETKKKQVIIAASAIGFYGDRGAAELSETSSAGTGFLSETCTAWENATASLQLHAQRFVTLRIGIVLSKEGGALKEMIQTIPFGIAPVLGNGKQIYSWIHVFDICAILVFVLMNDTVQGIYNAVAPSPVSQKTLMRAITRQVNHPVITVPAPAWMLKLFLGELASMVLISQNVSAEKITDTGYIFKFNTINAAMHDIYQH